MLRLLAYLYGKIIAVRNALYDKGVLETHDLGARTISVGNITTGGTGKTPLVAYIAEVLAARGEKVCILTRGYGRGNAKQRVLVSDGEQVLSDAKTGGDEPVELAHKLVGKAIVIADADRVPAAEWALRKFGVTVFVLDDGFQHRRVKRDLEIVCIDATDPFGGGEMLPAGRLREPLHNLSRAGVIVLMAEQPVPYHQSLRREIQDLAQNVFMFEALRSIPRCVRLEDFPLGSIKNGDGILAEHVFAFCGLGNPANFRGSLGRAGFQVGGMRSLDDHHQYSQKDIADIERAANEKGAAALLTTAKDAVKLSGLKFTLPCYVAEMELEFDDRAGFESLI